MEEREQQQRQREEQERQQLEEEQRRLQEQYGTSEYEFSLWSQALEMLRLQTSQDIFEAWIPQTQLLSLNDGMAVIGVPNPQTQEMLQRRLNRPIQRTLEDLLGRPLNLQFEVIDLTP